MFRFIFSGYQMINVSTSFSTSKTLLYFTYNIKIIFSAATGALCEAIEADFMRLF